MTSIKWTLSIKWALSPLFSYSWTDSEVKQRKCWEKKDPATEVQCSSDLTFQRRQEVWNQRNGPERRGGGEGTVPQSLWPGLQGQPPPGSSTWAGKFCICEHKGLQDRWQHDQGLRGTSELFLVHRNPSQNCSWGERKPASHPCCSRSSPDREYNAVLDYTAKGKITLVPCHRVQPFPISNHSAKSCLVCVVRSEPKWIFWPVRWKLGWKQLVCIGHQLVISYLTITFTLHVQN